MGAKLLIVDDDPMMLKLLEIQLLEQGYEIFTAVHGLQALEVLRDHRPRLVLADWSMPFMDGLQLCKAIRNDTSFGPTYLILLTAHSDHSQLIQAFEAGVDDYLTKPFDLEELQARLRAGERIIRLEQAMVEQAKAELEKDQLRQSVSAMEQVLGVIGHELRTPLAGIRMTAEFLLTPEAKTMGEWDPFLRSIEVETIRMGEMVNNLLEASRMASGKTRWNWQSVELEPVIQETLKLLRPLINQSSVELRCDVQPSSLKMLGDAGAIRRLIINLAGNACKFTPQGWICIRASRLEVSQTSWLELVIEDTGQGIPPHLVPGLGKPFALNSGVIGSGHIQGSGLGLSICQNIAAAHGGYLQITSTQGQGTQVRVRLRADLPAALETHQKIPLLRSVTT